MFARTVRACGRLAVPRTASALVARATTPHFSLSSQYSRTVKNAVAPIRHYSEPATLKVDSPQLMIAFTCKKCDTRSSHTFSKQAYHKGTVLIQCPGCKGRHLIADNLKIFKDNKFNLEEVMKAKGESVSTSTADLVFEDIPESLRDTIGHHAKDAPEEYLKKTEVTDKSLPSGKE